MLIVSRRRNSLKNKHKIMKGNNNRSNNNGSNNKNRKNQKRSNNQKANKNKKTKMIAMKKLKNSLTKHHRRSLLRANQTRILMIKCQNNSSNSNHLLKKRSTRTYHNSTTHKLYKNKQLHPPSCQISTGPSLSTNLKTIKLK